MFFQFIKRWLAVGLWMSLIFMGSTDLLSTKKTSRFIGPFLQWLVPDISKETVDRVVFVTRKCGHISEYAVLAVLFLRARRKTQPGTRLWWSGREFLITVGFCCVYAMTDELHQHFVASRFASVWDVMLDTFGASVGMGMVWLWCRWKKPAQNG